MSKKIAASLLVALSFVVFTPTSTKVNFEKVKNGTINVSQILGGICIIGAQFHKAYGLTKEIAHFCYHGRTVHCSDSPLVLLMWLGSKIGFSIVGLGLLKEGLRQLAMTLEVTTTKAINDFSKEIKKRMSQ